MNIEETLQELIAHGEILVPQGGNIFDGYNGELQPDYVSWRLQSLSAIEELGGKAKPILKELDSDSNSAYFLQDSARRVLGALKAALAIVQKQEKLVTANKKNQVKTNKENRKVFIVHGHQDALLNQVARFLEKLQLIPIILFEQAGRSNTIIEKLEHNSDVSFAIILLTPDDLGKKATDEGLLPRARQNVVFELGYFIGKLSRGNVVALYDESVELPSDYHGIEYIRIDAEGAWKMKLAKEIKTSGISIDMNLAI